MALPCGGCPAGLDHDLIHVDKGIGKDLLESVLARYSFVFQGAEYGRKPAQDRLKFEIERDDRAIALLIGVMWLQHASHWQPEDESGPGPLDLAGVFQRVTNGYLQGWADEGRPRWSGAPAPEHPR